MSVDVPPELSPGLSSPAAMLMSLSLSLPFSRIVCRSRSGDRPNGRYGGSQTVICTSRRKEVVVKINRRKYIHKNRNCGGRVIMLDQQIIDCDQVSQGCSRGLATYKTDHTEELQGRRWHIQLLQLGLWG